MSGAETSQKLIKQLVQHADRRQLKDADSLYEKLQQEMAQLLDVVEKPLQVHNTGRAFCHSNGWRQWRRQNHHHRQNGAAV